MRNPLVFVAFVVGCSFAACSSSSSSSPGGGNTSGGDGGSGTSSCSCSITYNGVSKTLQCGQSGCVNGSTFSCDSSATSSQGGTCTDTGGADSGTSSTGCSLFTCNSSSDCGGVAPCFSTSTTGTNYCYEQEGDPSSCSSGTTPTTKTTSNGATTICVPATCPQPVNFLP